MADEQLLQRTRFSDFKPVPTPSGQMYVVGYNPLEANLANQNARYTLEAIRNFIISGIPLSPGRWVQQPTITPTNNGDGTVTLAVSAGTADWNGIEQPYEAISYPNIPLPEAPLQQFVAVAALGNGTYEIKYGAQSQTPETPAISTGALLVNYVLLTSEGGDISQPPETGITEQRVLDLLAGYLKLLLDKPETVNTNGHSLTFDATNGKFQIQGPSGAGTFDLEDGWVYQNARYKTLTYLNRLFAEALTGYAQAHQGEIGVEVVDNGTKAAIAPFIRFWDGAGGQFRWDFKEQLYLNNVPYGGGGTGTAETATSIRDKLQTLSGDSRLDASAIKNLPTGGTTLGTGALAVSSGAMTVPMSSDGIYYAASYPTSISVDTTNNSLGRGVVCKIVANGTTAPTVAGATKHNSSANFNTTNGTSNTLRVWCEYNASNVKTNYYIWTQQ